MGTAVVFKPTAIQKRALALLKGGALVISRAIHLFAFSKQYLESRGFRNVEATGFEKGGIVFKINEIQPSLMFIASCFHDQATPFILGQLLKKFQN